MMDRISEFLDGPARANYGQGQSRQHKCFAEIKKRETRPFSYRALDDLNSFGKTAAQKGQTAEIGLEKAAGYIKKRPRTIRAYVDETLCTGCGICADCCVRSAITKGRTAIIDTNICTGCGKCVDACPAGALLLR